MNPFGNFKNNPFRMKAIKRKVALAQRRKYYPYPWETLEKDMKRSKKNLPLIVYGSLLNAGSSSETIKDQASTRRFPVIAFGFKRLFEYEMPLDGGRYGPPQRAQFRAALNVVPTDNYLDLFNGLLLEVSLRDIPPTRNRELGYDLLPIACVNWKETDSMPFLAYVLSCPNNLRKDLCRTTRQIKPHKNYYKVCRDGASEFGENFLQFWLDTTFLADRTTSARKWEELNFPIY